MSEDQELIVSFGSRRGFQAEAYARPDLVAGLGSRTRHGMLAPYLDRDVWGRTQWSDVWPQNHGFTSGQIYSLLWAERQTVSFGWVGLWDARRWLDVTGWDRKLPPWSMAHAAGRAHRRSGPGRKAGGKRIAPATGRNSMPATASPAPKFWMRRRCGARTSGPRTPCCHAACVCMSCAARIARWVRRPWSRAARRSRERACRGSAAWPFGLCTTRPGARSGIRAAGRTT